MSLAKKYGLTEAQIKAMYLGGDLPSSVFKRDQIVSHYNKLISQGISNGKAALDTAHFMDVSLQYVYYSLRLNKLL